MAGGGGELNAKIQCEIRVHIDNILVILTKYSYKILVILQQILLYFSNVHGSHCLCL